RLSTLLELTWPLRRRGSRLRTLDRRRRVCEPAPERRQGDVPRRRTRGDGRSETEARLPRLLRAELPEQARARERARFGMAGAELRSSAPRLRPGASGRVLLGRLNLPP